MATRNIVPRADSEGGIGTSVKRWATGFFDEIDATSYVGVSSGGTNKRIFRPANMKLDSTNTGCDNGTIFDVIDTVSFDTVTDGSIWMTMDFNDSDFDITSDLTIDLLYAFDGDAVGTQAVRIQIDAWVTDTGEAPVVGAPTVTQTTDLSVSTATDNLVQETTSFITVGNANLNANTRTISFKVTRDQDHANDDYDSDFHLINLVAKQ